MVAICATAPGLSLLGLTRLTGSDTSDKVVQIDFYMKNLIIL